MKDINYYLTSGEKTIINENVEKLASCIHAKSSTDTIREIMYLMNKRIPMNRNHSDSAKFKRSAEEIISDKSRNGCCDSCTLFTALCRAKGIPTMQVITADMRALKKGDYSRGHFFSACFLKESNEWVWVDSDKDIQDMSEVQLHRFNPYDEFIDKNYLIFAKTRDYSDFKLSGCRIDSISSMNKIHKMVYEDYLERNLII